MKKIILIILASILTLSCSKDSSDPNPIVEPVVKYTVQFQTSTGGTVSSSGGSYDKGAKLTITAIPDNEYVFDSWSDGNTDNPREIVVNSNINITATFVKKKYSLIVNVEGEGTVTEEVIVQGTTSTTEYNSGTTIKLEAIPDDEWVFFEWTGDIESNENPVELTVDQAKEVTATFKLKQYDLTINIEGEGTVSETIISQPATYDSGTVVKLEATPSEEWVFFGWTGDIESNDNPIEISVDATKEVTATFKLKQYDLTINIEGYGTVSEEIVTQSGLYNSGEIIRLTASAGEGWEFKEWQGDINSTENPYEVNVSNDLVITAVFIESQPPAGSITLDFYDIPEDQEFDHIFFANAPGWNQYYELDERMFKKVILYNSNDEPIAETLYKPEDNLQVELPLPTNDEAHYLKEYLFFKDDSVEEGSWQNTLLDNFIADGNLFNFRYQYEINYTDPIYSDTQIQYDIIQRNDALLLVDKNVEVSRVGVGTTGFAPGGRHIYVNSDYDSYPIRLYFDTYYIDKIVSPAEESTTIIEVDENDVRVDYPDGSTDLWKRDPIYASLKTNYDNGVTNELDDFIDAFKLEAQEFNVNLSSDPIISTQSSININGSEYLAITEDICGETKITVSSLFNELTFGQQVAVIYHEFGHAYFGYDHEDFGIMLPNISISQFRNYTALKSELDRFFNESMHSKVNCSGGIRFNPNMIEGQKLNKVFFRL